MSEESLSVMGSFRKTDTQFTKDGSINCTVSGGVGPFKMRVFDYMTGQYTEWLAPIEGNANKMVKEDLGIGSYHLEILDGLGNFHPYPMGQIRPRHLLEVEKNDGGNAILAPVPAGEPEIIYDFVALEENASEVSFGKLDVMKNNILYHEEGFSYPYNETGCYYAESELSKVTFDDWKVPEFTDYMYILNQIQTLDDEGIRDFFENTLDVNYEGYIEKGYEINGMTIDDRLSFYNTYAQYWLDLYEFKRRFVASTCKLELGNAAPEQMFVKNCYSETTDPKDLCQVRLVRRTGVINLEHYTFLEGWNYVWFPVGFEMDPVELFGTDGKVSFIKTVGSSSIVKIWWPQYGINTIDKLDNSTMYAVKATENFRVPI